MKQGEIYLDYAAATPLDPQVLAAMQQYLTDKFYNPSALYLPARQIKAELEAARAKVAHWFGARPNEIIFTAGGTEANNLAIHGIMQQFPEGNIVVSAIEHEAVLAPAGLYDLRIAPVTNEGLIDLDNLSRLIDEKTVLVSVMYANNEIGTIQPIKKIADIIKKNKEQRAKSRVAQPSTLNPKPFPLYFHADACQAAQYLDLHAKRLGVDLLTINAGKIYGPKQSGALFVRAGVKLKPQILGGGHEKNMRSGTESMAQIAGLATALDLVQSRRHKEAERVGKTSQLFVELLKKNIPSAIINGSLQHRLPNNVHITLPGQDNERLMMQLDERGVRVGLGSACSAHETEASHVLKAIGLDDKTAYSSLRFSLGRQTTAKDIQTTIQTLKSLL